MMANADGFWHPEKRASMKFFFLKKKKTHTYSSSGLNAIRASEHCSGDLGRDTTWGVFAGDFWPITRRMA